MRVFQSGGGFDSYIAFDVPSESHSPSDHSADRGAHAHRGVHIGCRLQYVGQGGSGGVRATMENLARKRVSADLLPRCSHSMRIRFKPRNKHCHWLLTLVVECLACSPGTAAGAFGVGAAKAGAYADASIVCGCM